MRQLQVCAQGHHWDPLADARPSKQDRWERCPTCGGPVEMISLRDTTPSTTSAAATAPISLREALPGYEIMNELGRGGMGIIYQARQLDTGRLVALKMISGGAQADPRDLARFRIEAEAVSRLQHPNIVEIYDVGEHHGMPYFALELMDRGSLAQALPRSPLKPRQAAELVEVLARAIQAAHEKGIIHRDLKPANVLLATPAADAPVSEVERLLGVPKISDFGLAKRIDDEGGQTRTGNILGTPAYMAPEQAEGKGPQISPATDVWALGAILYEAMTGRPPFKGATTLDTLDQVRSQDPVSPSRIRTGVPRELITICLKALHKEPHKRYASAAEMADDLARWLDHRPIRARPVPPWERAWVRARRQPAMAAMLAVTLAVAGMGLAAGVWLWSEARARSRQAEALKHEEENKRLAAEEARRIKVFYYASLVRRWGVPKGVARLDEAKAHRREVTYKFYQRGDRVVKVEAVGRHGQLTTRHTLLGYLESNPTRTMRLRPRSPCRWEYEYNERDEVTKEIAYDQAGMVVWNFHFTNRFTGYFTDRRGFPRPRVGSGAAFVSLVYSDTGLEREQRYLDRNDKPRAGPDGIFGRRAEHDERGLVVATTFLGLRDQPILHPLGFSKVATKHDKQGNVIERSYLGLDGKPALHRMKGYARETSRFDADGNLVEQRYFGIEGQPYRGPGGVAGTRLTYDERGLRASQVFLDGEGQPTANSAGVARIVFVHDRRDDCTEEKYFDLAGKPVLSESGAHRIVRVYDERHQVQQTAYFGPAGEPVALARTRIHKETTRHDERGQVVERTAVGVDGGPIAGQSARTTYAYSARGYPTGVAHFDAKGRPMLGPDGAARVVWTWDEQGNNVEQTCFGTRGELISPRDNFRVPWRSLPAQYARFVNTYDDRGNCTESVCYAPGPAGAKGPVVAARFKNVWDEQGHLLEMASYDGKGNLYAEQGPAKVTLAYDEQGHITERVAYGDDGEPMLTAGGAARHTRAFNEAGHLVREAFLDAEGGLRLGSNGYARAAFTYDEDGRLTESIYYDAFDNPLQTQVVVTANGSTAFGEALSEGDVILVYNRQPVVCARQFINLKRTEDYGRAGREALVLRGGKTIKVTIPSGPAVRFSMPNRRQIILSGLDSHLPVRTRAVAE